MGITMPKMGIKRRKSKSSSPIVSGVADALFTKVQQRVLAVLFGNHARSFYANELIAMACSGSGAVQRELAQLEAAQLVTVRRVGNQKHYQANASAPIFDELRGLVLKTSGLVDVLRAAVAQLAAQIDVAFVFGSVAKGTDTAGSDIDLLVISDKVVYAELFAAVEPATNQLKRTVNPTVYSRREVDKRIRDDNAFVKRVLAQPRLWVIGEESKLFSDVAPREMIREDRQEKGSQSVVKGIDASVTGSSVEKRAAGIVPAMIERRRRRIAQLCKRYEVRELALFGSILRSDFDPTSSDVDAAVKFGPPANNSLARQYFDFKAALEHLLMRPVDLVELDAMPDTRLKRIIEHTKVPIYAAAA
jgi:predicted nucleotidyltransferase